METLPTAPIVTAIQAWENLTRTLGWLPGFAAIAGMEILQSEPAVAVRRRMTGEVATEQFSKEFGGQAFHEKLGPPDGSLKFFSLHAYKDQFHGGGELAMITKYANTRQLQQECLWAVRTTMQISSVYWAETIRLATEAANDLVAV